MLEGAYRLGYGSYEKQAEHVQPCQKKNLQGKGNKLRRREEESGPQKENRIAAQGIRCTFSWLSYRTDF